MCNVWRLAASLVLFGAASMACAEIVIGVSISGSGPGASLGIPTRNTLEMLPKTIAGETVRLVMLDDSSDPANGTRIVSKLANEDRADIIIGSSVVPVAGAQAVVATELKVPFIALCPIALDPVKQPFVFGVPQPVPMMVDAVADHMQAAGIKSVAFIGFTDGWGDLTLRAITQAGAARGIQILAAERYARTDTSVNAQVIKVMATNPQAVFIGGTGTPGALPQLALVERGFKGPVYHTHGVVNQDFIRVGGRSAEGVIAPTGAIVVADQLPEGHPLKRSGPIS